MLSKHGYMLHFIYKKKNKKQTKAPAPCNSYIMLASQLTQNKIKQRLYIISSTPGTALKLKTQRPYLAHQIHSVNTNNIQTDKRAQ